MSDNIEKISLCGHLETIIGRYYLSGVGTPGKVVKTLFYDPSIDDLYGEVKTIKENIVAYLLANESIALVKKDMLQKIEDDTKGYNISFYAVESFEAEELKKRADKDIIRIFRRLDLD